MSRIHFGSDINRQAFPSSLSFLLSSHLAVNWVQTLATTYLNLLGLLEIVGFAEGLSLVLMIR